MPTSRTYTVRIYENGRTVQEVLSDWLRIPRKDVRGFATGHSIRVNKRIAVPAARVRAGDVVEIHEGNEDVGSVEPSAIALEIVHEDEDLIVLNKPPYLLVHPARPGHIHSLINGIAHHYRATGEQALLHPVHRLDRDTSGLVLVAKSPAVHRILAAQLHRRELSREYLAWVWGTVAEDIGRIDAPIGQHPRQSMLRAVLADGEPSSTRFQVVERYAAATLVRLVLETGRTHQIRVHMAHIGHPLLGDRQYGRKGLKLIARQALHAERLSFHHPRSSEPVGFLAPVPPDLGSLRARLLT